MVRHGGFVTNYVTQAGTVIVVGEEPLLEAFRSTNGMVQARLYAPVGSTNVVQTSRELPAMSWTTGQPVTMTNLLQSLPPLSATNRTFRAFRAGHGASTSCWWFSVPQEGFVVVFD